MALAHDIRERLLTGEDLARWPELNPCELIDGRLVPMSPTGHRHGALEVALASELRTWARANNAGQVLAGEVGLYIRRDPDTVRAADVLFISEERYARVTSPAYLDVAPELVVEILSPDDRWSEVTAKINDYLSVGVDLVWVVDDRLKQVFAYRSRAEVKVFGAGSVIEDVGVLPGFRLGVGEIFT